jgi:cytochrome P450
MPTSEDWTEVTISKNLVRIIAIVSGYIFLGPDLCRNEEYMDLAIGYTIDAFTCVAIIRMVPDWMRSFVIYIVPHYWRIGRYRRRVRDFLLPIIRARKAAALEPGYEAPDDLLQWTIKKAPRFEEIRSDNDIAQMQLRLSLAAIHTTSLTATSV